MLDVLERSGNTTSLSEVFQHATTVLKQFQEQGVLDAAWHVEFDLAPKRSRPVSCLYGQQRIQLAVGHCLKADAAEIRDTVLHEIAHALAGPKHHHDSHWKEIAKRIGCTAERCTTVKHSAGRWIGRCGCGGRTYERQRLTARARRAVCRRCNQQVRWAQDNEGHKIQ